MVASRKTRTRGLLSGLAIIAVAAVSFSVVPAGADQVSDKQAEAAQISAKLAELDAKKMELDAQYERANYALSQAQDKVAEAQRVADETAAEMQRRQDDIRRFSVQAYTTGNDSPEFDAVVTSDSSAGVEKRAYLQATTGNRQDLIDSLNATKEKAAADAERLQAAQNEAEAHAQEIATARSAAGAASDEQRAINSRVQGELATLVAEENAKRAAAAAAAAPPAPANTAATAPAPAAGAAGGTTAGPTPTTNGAPAPAAPTAPAPATKAPPVSSAPPVRGGAGGAIAAALSKIGSPYVWGAAGPNVFDCSGLVLWAYAQVGVSLPHYSGAQYAMTTRISASQLQPGDLVFWGAGGSEHVAIYMGGNQLVHAFGSGVATTQLAGWWKTPTGYGRL